MKKSIVQDVKKFNKTAKRITADKLLILRSKYLSDLDNLENGYLVRKYIPYDSFKNLRHKLLQKIKAIDLIVSDLSLL